MQSHRCVWTERISLESNIGDRCRGRPRGDQALKSIKINAITGKVPGLHAVGVCKYEVRDEPGTYRPTHVVTKQKVANEGIILQAGHELRDIGWAGDPSKVSTKVLAKETLDCFVRNVWHRLLNNDGVIHTQGWRQQSLALITHIVQRSIRPSSYSIPFSNSATSAPY